MGIKVRTIVTWNTSNVEWLLSAVRWEGEPSSCVAVICIQFQVQDVLFYGDWRERKEAGQILPKESSAHCFMLTLVCHY